jgi:hypothetical protein
MYRQLPKTCQLLDFIITVVRRNGLGRKITVRSHGLQGKKTKTYCAKRKVVRLVFRLVANKPLSRHESERARNDQMANA